MRVQPKPLHEAGKVNYHLEKAKSKRERKNAGKTWKGHSKKTRLGIDEGNTPTLSTVPMNAFQKKAGLKKEARIRLNLDGKRRQENKQSTIVAGLGIMLAGAFVCGVASNCNNTQETSQGNGPKEDSKDQHLAKNSPHALAPNTPVHSMAPNYNGFLRNVQNTLWGLATYDPFPSFPPVAAADDACKAGANEKNWHENPITLTTKEAEEFESPEPDFGSQLHKVSENEFNELLVDDVLKNLYKKNPALLFLPDQRGYTFATTAIRNGNSAMLKTLHELDPTLLHQSDDQAYTPATSAVKNGNSDIIKTLHELDPALLSPKKIVGSLITILVIAIAYFQRKKLIQRRQEEQERIDRIKNKIDVDHLLASKSLIMMTKDTLKLILASKSIDDLIDILEPFKGEAENFYSYLETNHPNEDWFQCFYSRFVFYLPLKTANGQTPIDVVSWMTAYHIDRSHNPNIRGSFGLPITSAEHPKLVGDEKILKQLDQAYQQWKKTKAAAQIILRNYRKYRLNTPVTK